MAAEAGFSKFHFARAFKDAFGETPANYLTRRRLERAKDLLHSANLTVTEVCMLVGFSSLGSFSARFSELVGMAPSAFQKASVAGAARRRSRAASSWSGAGRSRPAERCKSASAEKPDGTRSSYPDRTNEPSARSEEGTTAMISHVSHATVYVLDQDSAKAFYTEKLGLELRLDINMGEEFEGAGAGFRWLTVGAKDQPDLQIVLSSCDMGRSPEAAAQLRELVASGALGVCVLATDDCHRSYKELLAKDVTFLSEPAERPYGIEATLRDDSGNIISLTQAFAFDGGAPAS